MKFQVGDKVRIRTDLKTYIKYGEQTFMAEMKVYKGQIATITEVLLTDYKINLDRSSWYWTDEMFEEIRLKEDKDLNQILLDNPDAKIMVAISEDDYVRDYITEVKPVMEADVYYLTLYNDNYVDEADLLERIRKDFSCDKYENLTDDEFEKVCIEESKKYKFTKYIILYF